MKKIILTLLLANSLFTVAQQDNFDKELHRLTHQIDSIVREKNAVLHQKIDSINRLVAHKEISPSEADAAKEKWLMHYAEELDYTIYKKTVALKALAKNKEILPEVKINKDRNISYTIRVVKQGRKKQHEDEKKSSGTTSFFIVGIGINNTLANGKPETIDLSPYQIGNSRFFELGCSWKTPVVPKKLFLRYGTSFMWNTLKPKDKKVHEVIQDTIRWVSKPYDVQSSKLRNIWCKVPLSVEADIPRNGKKHLHIGFGMYGKIRLVTKQKLKYEDAGRHSNSITKNAYNQHLFNYGLTAEIGGTHWSIYIDYDMAPLFYHRNMQLVSVGYKLEM